VWGVDFRLSWRGLLLPVFAAALAGCDQTRPDPAPSPAAPTKQVAPKRLEITGRSKSNEGAACRVRFVETAAQSGIDFVYENGATGRELMVESLGGGAAWFDYDADGLVDLYFTQGGQPDVDDRSSQPRDALYRQTGSGQFQAVTNDVLISCHEYGMGVAVADYDNDGFDDIYVTAVGPNRFFRNCGDGTFEEATLEAGVEDDRWSTSAAWGDLDQDGDLDLYCCNYLQYDPMDPLECLKDGRPALCHPRQLEAWPDECFENLGDGTFARASSRWQLEGEGNKGLGVVIADLNNDARPDVYVANDTTANFLFLATESDTFEESALRFGGALSAEGAMQASMGVALGDYDGNGFLDLFLAHFTGESNTLYQNLGESGLHDVSGPTGVRRISNDYLGFGTVLHDFDQNGTPELLVANGHIDSQNADGAGYAQHACVMTWANPQWNDVSESSGEYFTQPKVGRAVATADFDGDGDLDVVIANQNSPAALLENTSERGHWLAIRLIGTRGNRSATGTRVIVTQGDRKWIQELAGGTSYCSSHEKLLVFGFGESSTPCQVEIRWPNGNIQQFDEVPTSQHVVVVESASASL
jgi:hypothetical protein